MASIRWPLLRVKNIRSRARSGWSSSAGQRWPSHVTVQRRKGVQLVEHDRCAAQRAERRNGIEGHRATGDLVMRIGLPIVRNHPEAALLGPPRHDRAAGEQVDERATRAQPVAFTAAAIRCNSFRLLPM